MGSGRFARRAAASVLVQSRGTTIGTGLQCVIPIFHVGSDVFTGLMFSHTRRDQSLTSPIGRVHELRTGGYLPFKVRLDGNTLSLQLQVVAVMCAGGFACVIYACIHVGVAT